METDFHQRTVAIMNPEKLAKLQANQNRSKGTPRRVIKKVHRPVAQDDRKLQGALEKLSLAPQPYVDEVNMFLQDGSVLHFRHPKGEKYESCAFVGPMEPGLNNSLYVLHDVLLQSMPRQPQTFMLSMVVARRRISQSSFLVS